MKAVKTEAITTKSDDSIKQDKMPGLQNTDVDRLFDRADEEQSACGASERQFNIGLIRQVRKLFMR